MINVPYEDMPREIEALLGEIEQLEQEKQQLKEQLEKKYKEVGTLTNEILYEENTKLLSVLDEIREYCKYGLENWFTNSEVTDDILEDILQILDKVKQ